MINMLLAAPWWVWVIVALIVGAGVWCWFAQRCLDEAECDYEDWHLWQ